MDISALGVRANKAKQFEKKGIMTVEDLLSFYPRKYIDYTHPKTCSQIIPGEDVAIYGKIIKATRNTEKKYSKIVAFDRDNVSFDIFWFGNPWGLQKLIIGNEYLFCGKATENFQSRIQLSNPTFFEPSKNPGIFPVYSKIAGMSDEYLKNTINKAISSNIQMDILEKSIIDRFGLIESYKMIRYLHCPKTISEIALGKKRFVFDELFKLAYEMERNFKDTKYQTDIILKNMSSVKPFLNTLPFSLTDGPESQLETVRGIVRKINKGYTTSSLVQGDVGCGKTFVALLMMLLMAENGYQSCLMAPTNILATQHFEDISAYLKDIEWAKPVLLTAGLKKKEKDKILNMVKTGEVNMVIGTHSVISDCVEFKNLGLSIVDEEHRFGVIQRDKMKKKIGETVHSITMSATPIPRSLGLSLYGEGVDIYTITKMPNGRKSVITSIETDATKAYDFLEKEIMNGRQGYIVCPLIEEAESEKMVGVKSVNETYDEISAYFSKNPSIKIGCINGKMKNSEVEAEIEKFNRKEYNVIISTTIIEVGVNVPNSTVMIIQNAERFGLAQLHQLRGRVGRGSYQSYCILVSQKEDVERLDVMTKTTNGFVIAEEDLKLRGMGDFIGTKQSGMVKNVMLMLSHPDLYAKIKAEVKDIFKDEKRLKFYRPLQESLDKMFEEEI